ncbi:MAG TPA: hypothetical protein VMH91_04495 [Candidatus Paceibacterota bacterium]|nr:hypothetical protein [Candidatus Paceibacterota bacterium]
MNKTVLWVVAAIIVIGGGYWLYSSGALGGGSGGEMMENSTSTSQGQSSGSMKDLLAHGSSQCQVNDTANGSSGTVYVGNGEMRGDFTSQTQTGTVTSHMISDGQTVYVWSSAAPQGMKMSVSSETSSSGSSSAQDPYNENVNYTCSPWSVDSAEFTLPAGVTFEDMSTMMHGSASGGASVGANAAQCAACDQAPNATAKAQCRAALQCQ